MGKAAQRKSSSVVCAEGGRMKTVEEEKARCAAYNKNYRASHKAERKQYDNEYYLSHKKEKTERNRVYGIANRDRLSALRVEHRSEERIRSNAFYAANKVEISIKHKKYGDSHKEESALYRSEHKAESSAWNKSWLAVHKEKSRLHGAKRRALKYNNTPISEMLTSTEWLAILAEAAGHCHYCGEEAKLTLDHVIPLSRGGKHSKNNVVPACQRCNFAKHTKTLEEWSGLSVAA